MWMMDFIRVLIPFQFRSISTMNGWKRTVKLAQPVLIPFQFRSISTLKDMLVHDTINKVS